MCELQTKGAPKYAIIIPHYEDIARLTLCLDALLANTDEMMSDVEVVVVDNGSSQSLADLKARFSQVRYLLETEKGAAAARNKGVAHTTAPFLFFIDADCIPSSNWLQTAKEAVQRADLVGGHIETFDETPPPKTGAEAFEAVFAFRQKFYIEQKGFSVSANLLTTRTVFERTGGFIGGLSEDVDWCQRALTKGYRLEYAPDLILYHPTRQDWDALFKKWRRLTDEGFYLNGVSAQRRLLWAIRAGLVFLSLCVHVPKLLISPKLAGAKERIAGSMTLIRLRLWRCYYMLLQAIGLRS